MPHTLRFLHERRDQTAIAGFGEPFKCFRSEFDIFLRSVALCGIVSRRASGFEVTQHWFQHSRRRFCAN